jgi:peptidyl-prolyl cis-trans isomerase B (cyclophilin B)
MRSIPRAFLVLALVVTAALAVSLAAGCGNEQQSSTETKGAGSAQAQKTTAAEPAAGEKPAATAETTEKAGTVMKPLTKIVDGKREVVDVPYLPPGKKIATVETTKGTFKIELWEDKAPNTVTNFVSLANSGRYDGVAFHRVIDGFVAQTGDVENRGGYGGPGYTIPAEFDPNLKHVRGVVSMARGPEPDSAGSQFFIMLGDAPTLDGKYAAFGRVIEGMDVVDKIKKGDRANNGAVENPDRIIKVRVESVPEK